MRRGTWLSLLAACAMFSPTLAAEKPGMAVGKPDIKSMGALAFGPDGVLFVGDTASAAIFAIDTEDGGDGAGETTYDIKSLDGKIAGMLGTTARDIMINDLIVNPESGNLYASVHRGRGPDETPVLVRINTKGEINVVSLESVAFAKAELPNAPEPGGTGRRNLRSQSITDLNYVDGRVIVAGLSNEEFASNLRAIPFPFAQTDRGASVEIFHGAHGRFETRSPVRTFIPFKIDGESHLLAAYTCTPLVKFPVASLKAGQKVQGTTVAELGNRNSPLDMVVYEKDGRNYLLIANTARGVMKVTTDGIDKIEAITEPVTGGGTAGLKYETIESLKGVTQLSQLSPTHAVILQQTEDGPSNLVTIALP